MKTSITINNLFHLDRSTQLRLIDEDSSRIDLIEQNITVEQEQVLPIIAPRFHPNLNKSATEGLKLLADKNFQGLTAPTPPYSKNFVKTETQRLIMVRDGIYFHPGSHIGVTFVGKWLHNNIALIPETVVFRPLSVDPSYPGSTYGCNIAHKITCADDMNTSIGSSLSDKYTNNLTVTLTDITMTRVKGTLFSTSPYAKLYPWDRITGSLSRVSYLKRIISNDLFKEIVFVVDKHISARHLSDLQDLGILKILPIDGGSMVFGDWVIDLPDIKLNNLYPTHNQLRFLREDFRLGNYGLVDRENIYFPRPPLPHWRGVINQSELTETFRKRGFVIGDDDFFKNNPLREIASRLFNSKIVVSHSGSSTVNSLFCKEQFITLSPLSCPAVEHFATPATFSDLTHHFLFSSYDIRTNTSKGDLNPFSFFSTAEVERLLDLIS